jgi:SAM-dependent MidA family methyltransferase
MSAAKEPVQPPSPAFIDAFRQRAAATSGVLSFASFMDLALYHPELGYYRRDRARVGRSAETDFYTATSSGPLFGELIVAACVKLLGPQTAPRSVTFVEIGAEPGGGILRNVAHPFTAAHTLRIGEPLDLHRFTGSANPATTVGPTPLIIFSNELFDAQPFRRFVTHAGQWRELGVTLTADNTLHETELPATFQPLPSTLLPSEAAYPDGYHLDLPLASADLAAQLAAQPWSGLFIACDYGKSWRELIEATPQGTARAYHRHQQSNDLLAHPGEQDLTCHVCWDWLADALARHGFASPTVESQEAFLIHHAGDFIARLTAAEATRMSPRKLSLMQLLHPANMGQKFQVLHALRK